MHPKKILIIDDDRDDREIFCDALAEVDPSAVCYSSRNGIEAIEMLTAPDAVVPDFIFLDLNMPIMSGKQCLAELKKIRKLHRSHIVIYTTSKLADDFSDAISMGALHFLTKPARFSELRTALSNVLAENWELVK